MKNKIVSVVLALLVFCLTINTAVAATLTYGKGVYIDSGLLTVHSLEEWLSSSSNRAMFAVTALYAADQAFPAEKVTENWNMLEGFCVSEQFNQTIITAMWERNDGDSYCVFHSKTGTQVYKYQKVPLLQHEMACAKLGNSYYTVSLTDALDATVAMSELLAGQ